MSPMSSRTTWIPLRPIFNLISFDFQLSEIFIRWSFQCVSSMVKVKLDSKLVQNGLKEKKKVVGVEMRQKAAYLWRAAGDISWYEMRRRGREWQIGVSFRRERPAAMLEGCAAITPRRVASQWRLSDIPGQRNSSENTKTAQRDQPPQQQQCCYLFYCGGVPRRKYKTHHFLLVQNNYRMGPTINCPGMCRAKYLYNRPICGIIKCNFGDDLCLEDFVCSHFGLTSDGVEEHEVLEVGDFAALPLLGHVGWSH
jgi:hypothetical protein